ncbi:MAG: M1 family metallopeptidase, partial [Caulobacteraceae bacterium]
HPVIEPAETIAQVEDVGDAITYDKGAAVIRMLAAYVGEDAWRAGVQSFLRAHAYGNATHDDLWAAVGAASKKPIDRTARDFTEQDGLPLVGVQVMGGQKDSALLLTEGRFMSDGSNGTDRWWRIPVTARAATGGPVTGTVVRPGSLIYALHNPGPQPLVVNPGQVGYFRTAYSAPAFTALTARLGRLDPSDQLGMIYDAWALGAAGDTSASDVLRLLDRLPAGADPRVWEGSLGILSEIDTLYDGLPGQGAFRAWARGRLKPVLAQVGWAPRSRAADTFSTLRGDLLVTLAELGDPEVIAEARARFERFRQDPSSLPADIRQSVLDIVGLSADAQSFESLAGMAQGAADPQEKRQYLTALAQARDPAIARRALDLALSPMTPVTLSPVVIRRVAARHPRLAFEFATTHAAALKPRLDPSQQVSFVPSLVSPASDATLADALDAYAARTFPEGGRRDAAKASAKVRQQAKVRSGRLPEIDKWLKSGVKG